METRYVGDVVVCLEYVGPNHKERRSQYAGTVQAGNHCWAFDDLYSPHWIFHPCSDSPEAFDVMAEMAVSFATVHTSDNRDEDIPGWAPTAETADAIESAAWNRADSGEFVVTRDPVKA